MEIHDGRATLTREELYEQVWTTPMRRLAPTYGLSDVGLRKVCARHQIPTPPAGYWARKEFGKRVEQVPLPALAGESPRPISLAHDPAPKPRGALPPSCPVTDPDLLEAYLREGDPEHRVRVPDHLWDCHPIIRLTRESVSADRKPNLYNHIGPDYPAAYECAAISVARESFKRALRLMNCLFRQLEKRGHGVIVRPPGPGHAAYRNRVKCLMLGEEFGFCLREKARMVRASEGDRREAPPSPTGPGTSRRGSSS